MKTVNSVITACLLSSVSSFAGVLSFTNFHTPPQVDAALTTLHNTYPGKTSIITIGTSYGGNPIKALKISSNPGVNDPTKGDVVYVALHHAREWISVEVALYLADELLARYSTDATLHADMDRLQIWIIPVVNPDGYAYTTTDGSCSVPTSPRMWRKNRRPNGDGTYGVDLNRNWGYQWGLLSGSSNITADDTYHGTGAFSEPETKVIRDFLNGLTNFKSFVTYHSFSELYLRPWSYTTSDPPGEPTLKSIAQRNINLIAAVHGHTYSENIWYTSSGEATDWVWQEKRVAAFTPELRPGPTGAGGFCVAASEIIPCAEENFPAANALIHDAARSGVWIRDNAGDTGAEPSTGYPWESPDIWTVPAVLNQNATVDLHIHVSNSTGTNMKDVTVDAYYTDPRITLEFPSPTAVLIGSAVVNVPPPGKDVVMSWTTPVGTNIWGELHWCVGVVIKHKDDMPLTTIVNRSSNIACHNFNTTTVVEGGIINVAATNFLSGAAELVIDFNRNELPPDWKLELPPIKELQSGNRILPPTIRKSRLLKTQGVILEPGQTVKIPVKVHFAKVPAKEVLVRIKGDLLPLVAGERTPVGNGYSFNVTAK
jgi:carboxypeptidase T